ncbi:MAG: aminotransferase class I/II-fold pyridoxal phosphate-dependent enzyme [Candidatus Thermoplasmatota archaeon]
MENCTRTENISDAPIQKLLSEVKIPNDSVNFGQGLPFFGPPESSAYEASDALKRREGYSYSPDAGFSILREEISKKLEKQNRIKTKSKNVVVTSGGNQAFINTILAITNPGEEIIVLSPFYFNHVMAIKLASCNPMFVKTKKNFQPDLEEIFEKYSKKTAAIITVSPNNPTGAVYSKQKLRKINDFCRKNNIYHISDEAYEHFTYDGKKHYSPACFDKDLEYTISLFSFSKSYGMAGYRIGYMVVPSNIKKEVLKVQDTVTICPNGPSQFAAYDALRIHPFYTKKNIPMIKENRVIFLKELEETALPVKLRKTFGAFYFMVEIDTDKKSWWLSKKLIEKHGVITIPGTVFGCRKTCLRLSYGNIKNKKAEEGIKRLKKGLKNLL